MVAERTFRPAIAVERVGHPARSGLDEAVLALVREAELDRVVGTDHGFFKDFMAQLQRALEDAFARREERALRAVHRSLYHLYEQNFATPANPQAANQFHPFLLRVRSDIERAWERFETARAHIRAEDIPTDAAAFSRFFKARCSGHRLARHPLFDFLEFKAGRDELVQFFMNDRALILRFCDLVSLAMIGADEEVRGELAVNLWDEMGNGDPAMRHTVLFRRLLNYVGCEADHATASTEPYVGVLDWQGFAGYNLHLFFSLHRRNYFKSVGCLGSSEFMDSGQYAKILRGCHRVGLEDTERLAYYASHVEIDAGHGETWLANVLVPLVLKYPEARNEIVLGAEMRLNVTADYYDAILARLVAAERRRVPDRLTAASFVPLSDAG
jgi:Iron-containing redox enzyme